MSKTDLRSRQLALFLSSLAVLASAFITERVYERIPHLEDELAYVWQARTVASGHLTLPTPPNPDSFLVPFVVDFDGQRFSKYPLGWPVVLGLGIILGLRDWVNPLLAGLGVWLTYRLGTKVFGRTVGLIAAGLTVTSPFMLLNSGSLLSHPWGLVLSAAFALAWLDAFRPDSQPRVPPWLATLSAALVMGVFVLSRPFTASGIALPFVIHGLYLLVRSDQATRRRLLVFAVLVTLLTGLHFIWQYSLTGDALLNPYTLCWSYDKLGFGPGHGVVPYGHTIKQALFDARFGLRVGASDLFGWGRFSWIFLPFGLWAMRRNRSAWLITSVFPSLVIIYLAYWVNAWLYGPRYYYEGLYSLTLVTAAGIAWLAGWPGVRQGWQKARPLAVTALLACLVAVDLVFYLPPRMETMVGLYGIRRENLTPFQTQEAQALTPALIMVDTPRWMPYGALLELEDPALTTPFIFAWSVGPRTDAAVIANFPGRSVYYYYPEDAYKFYTGPMRPW